MAINPVGKNDPFAVSEVDEFVGAGGIDTDDDAAPPTLLVWVTVVVASEE